MAQGLIERDTLVSLANAIRAKNGSTSLYTPSQMVNEITNLQTEEHLEHKDIPNYVKNEAYALAQKLKTKIQSNSIIILIGTDSHQYEIDDAGVDNATKQTTARNTTAGNLHAGQAMKALSYMIPFDFAAFLGDYTAGGSNTTKADAIKHFTHINSYIDDAFQGLPQFRTLGNHDSLGYSLGAAGFTLQELYTYIGRYNEINGNSMGNIDTQSGYCYRDFADKKYRVICLNTSDGTSTPNGVIAMSTAQQDWFANLLQNHPAGYGLIILSHVPLDWIMIPSNILFSYLTKSSYNNYNFTNVTNLPTWTLCFHGHTHGFRTEKLYQNKTTKSQYDVYEIANPCMNYSRTNEYGVNNATESYGIEFGVPADRHLYDKIQGAKDTSFCAHIINPGEHKVYSFCYGAGYERILDWTQNITHVTGISFSESSGELIIGNTLFLNPIITPENAFNPSVLWSSSDENVAIVSNGTVTAVSEGSAVITATTQDGGFQAIFNLTVQYPLIEPNNEIPDHSYTKDKSDIYNNGLGYKNNTYISYSGDKTSNGYVATGYIPLNNLAELNFIYIRGVTINSSSGCLWTVHNGTNNMGTSYSSQDPNNTSGSFAPYALFSSIETLGRQYYKLTINHTFTNNYLSDLNRHIRFSFMGTGEHLWISFNNPIIDEYYPWAEPTETYSITYILSSNISSTNNDIFCYEASSYTTQLISSSFGYEVDSTTVSIVMNNIDITNTAYNSTTNQINIENINGDISITALEKTADYTGNLVSKLNCQSGIRYGTSDGLQKTDSNAFSTGDIDIKYFMDRDSTNTVTIRTRGARLKHNTSSGSWDNNAYSFYPSTKERTYGDKYGKYFASESGTTEIDNVSIQFTFDDTNNDNNTTMEISNLTDANVADNTGKFRYLRLTGTGNLSNFEIYINEPFPSS